MHWPMDVSGRTVLAGWPGRHVSGTRQPGKVLMRCVRQGRARTAGESVPTPSIAQPGHRTALGLGLVLTPHGC